MNQTAYLGYNSGSPAEPGCHLSFLEGNVLYTTNIQATAAANRKAKLWEAYREAPTAENRDALTKEYSYDVADDNTVYLHYKRDVVRMYKEDGTTPVGADYPSPYWTDWLTMITVDPQLKQYDRPGDKEGTTPVAINTKFNWVRGYTYEWKATGLEK